MITGFRPFPGVPNNPSSLLLESLRTDSGWVEDPSVSTRFILLDTVYEGLAETIEQALAAEPDALVMTGYSALATGLKLETSARDCFTVEKPDASGFLPATSEASNVCALNEGIDFDAMTSALEQSGVDACLSDDAGAYVCNRAYWLALELIRRERLRTRALFVHIPAIDGMADAPEGARRMSLADLRRGMGIIVEQLVR